MFAKAYGAAPIQTGRRDLRRTHGFRIGPPHSTIASRSMPARLGIVVTLHINPAPGANLILPACRPAARRQCARRQRTLPRAAADAISDAGPQSGHENGAKARPCSDGRLGDLKTSFCYGPGWAFKEPLATREIPCEELVHY